MSHIWKLKVKATQVEEFPFDIVYIIPESLKDVIPRLFAYSLCLPFNDELILRISQVAVSTMTTLTPKTVRDDLPDEIGPGQCKRARQGVTRISDVLSIDTLRQSFMVIPVLPRTHKKTRSRRSKDRNASYLIANMHRRGEHETKRGGKRTIQGDEKDDAFLAFFNDFTVMFTPRGPVRPVCRLCPRHLEHIQGKCTLGMQPCYESLVIQPERKRADEQLQKR